MPHGHAYLHNLRPSSVPQHFPRHASSTSAIGVGRLQDPRKFSSNRWSVYGRGDRVLKSSIGKRSAVCESMREVDGSVIKDSSRNLEQWKEHFEDLMNRPAPPVSMFDLPFEGFLGVPDNCPTTAEIKKAVSTIYACQKLIRRRRYWSACFAARWPPSTGAASCSSFQDMGQGSYY